MGSGSGQSQRAFGMRLSEGKAGQAFQNPSDPALVSQPGKDIQGFAVGLVGSYMVSPLAVDVGQVGQGAGGAPRVSGFSKGRKSTLIQGACGLQIVLGTCHVALLID